ncbi:hypothetical protein [Synechococcus sp. PCC 6312]|uniref:hypothetical protein n=1 Tax=Synechococcus sp. (strain ATCC 27167 / PCC 6312) TaxID=195253 RepID=UPI00029F4655|nr:hypothetical protein [Synechococcus sp. PCC 6312]AFY61894.1 hypothetical protein Syn6312_2818 [Synechococcus sp. PCC 6312]
MWKAELNIRDLITGENLEGDALKHRSQELAKRLKQFQKKQTYLFLKNPYGKEDFEEIIESFETYIQNLDQFNEELKNLWDWCDLYEVWVPFPNPFIK